MPTRVPFCFVDVFADRPLTGNPLALVTDADGLAEPQMRAIAREFNQSETTFLLHPSLPGATWRLRSFTPIGAEVGGAGHNALGAWLWLAATGRIRADDEGPGLTQEISGQVLAVEVTRDGDQPATVWMDQSPPQFGEPVPDRARLAAALGLSVDDLAADEPAQVVSTGAGHLLVPARHRVAVDRAAPDAGPLAAVLRQAGGEGCYLYSLTRWTPRAQSRTRDSSIRPWASAKTRPRGRRRGRWSPGSSPWARSRTASRPSSSKVTRWDGPAGSRSPCPGSASAWAAQGWS